LDEPPIETWTRDVVLREAPSIAHALNEHELPADIQRRLRRMTTQQLVILAALLQAAGFL
jgi:hypothetical protein